MKAIVMRQEFADAMATLAGIVPSRTIRPVLACARIKCGEGNLLVVEATDLAMFARVKCEKVQVESQGETLVNCAKLASIARELTDDTISVEVDGDTLRVRASYAEFTLPTMNPADLPEMPAQAKAVEVTLPAKTLATLIRQTRYAAADDARHYAMNGIRFIADKGHLSLAASEGHVVAEAVADVSGKAKASGIIPADVVAKAEKMCEGADDATIFLSENAARFTIGNATLATNLLEGVFPPIEDIFPRDCDHMATIGRDELVTAIRQAALTAEVGTSGVKLKFDFAQEHGLRISGNSGGDGSGHVTVACKFEGKPLCIGLQSRFLLDALRVGTADEIKIEMVTPSRPALLHLGGQTRCVVAPFRVAK